MPPKLPIPVPITIKKQSKIKAFFFGKKSRERRVKPPEKVAEVGIVEELFEQGSAILAER